MAIPKTRKATGLTLLLVEESVESSVGMCDYADRIQEYGVETRSTPDKGKRSEVRQAYREV